MSRAKQDGSLFAVGIAVVALVGAAGMTVVAEDEPEGRHGKEKMRIVITDDSGDREEEVFEFDEEHPRPFLGVTLSAARDGGARVDQVMPDSGAERAGLEAGDVIVEINGQKVERPWDLTRRVLRQQPGDRVDLELMRDGASRMVTVELGDQRWPEFSLTFDLGDFGEQMGRLGEQLGDLDLDLDLDLDWDSGAFEDDMRRLHESLEGLDLGGDLGWSARSRPKLGVELVEATPELREHLGSARDEGVLVGRVLPGLPAETSGVRVGDLIVAVDGNPIADVRDLRRALADADGRTIDLEVVRDRQPLTLSVSIPESRSDDDGGRGIRFRRPDAHPVPVVDPLRRS